LAANPVSNSIISASAEDIISVKTGQYAPDVFSSVGYARVLIQLYANDRNISKINFDPSSYSYQYDYNKQDETVSVSEVSNQFADEDFTATEGLAEYNLSINKNGYYKLTVSAVGTSDNTVIELNITHIPQFLNEDETITFDAQTHQMNPKYFSHSYKLANPASSGIIDFETLRSHLYTVKGVAYSQQTISYEDATYNEPLDAYPYSADEYIIKIEIANKNDENNYINKVINFEIEKATPNFPELVTSINYSDTIDMETNDEIGYFDKLLDDNVKDGFLYALNPINTGSSISGDFEWVNTMPDKPILVTSKTNPFKQQKNHDGRIQFYQEFDYDLKFTVGEDDINKANYEDYVVKKFKIRVFLNPLFETLAPIEILNDDLVEFKLQYLDDSVQSIPGFSWTSKPLFNNFESLYFFLGWRVQGDTDPGFLGNFSTAGNDFALSMTEYFYELDAQEILSNPAKIYSAYFTKLSVKFVPVDNSLISSDPLVKDKYTHELVDLTNFDSIPYYGFNYSVEYSLTFESDEYLTVTGESQFDVVQGAQPLNISINAKKTGTNFDNSKVIILDQDEPFRTTLQTMELVKEGDLVWEDDPSFNIKLSTLMPSEFIDRMEFYFYFSDSPENSTMIKGGNCADKYVQKVDDYNYTLKIENLSGILTVENFKTFGIYYTLKTEELDTEYGYEIANNNFVVAISNTGTYKYDPNKPFLTIKRDSNTIYDTSEEFNDYDWVDDTINISVEPKIDLPSGTTIYIKTPSTDWTEISNDYSNNFTLETESGIYYYVGISGAGIESDIYTVEIKIDKTAPIMYYQASGSIAGIAAWTGDVQNIKVRIVDTSGVDSFQVFTTPYYDKMTNPLDVTATALEDNQDGTYSIKISTYNYYTFLVADKLGKTTNTIVGFLGQTTDFSELQLKVDAAPVVFKVIDDHGYYDLNSWTDDEFITFGVEIDYRPSGVIVEYSVDAGATFSPLNGPDDFDNINPDYDVTLPVQYVISNLAYIKDENTYIEFRATVVGHTNPYSTEGLRIKRDRTKPEIVKPLKPDDEEMLLWDVIEGKTWALLPFIFKFKLADEVGGSDIDSTSVKLTPTNSGTISFDDTENKWQISFSNDVKNVEYTLEFKDNAGNIGELKFTPTFEYFDTDTIITSKYYEAYSGQDPETSNVEYNSSKWINGTDNIQAVFSFNLVYPIFGDTLIFYYKRSNGETVNIETIQNLNDSAISNANPRSIRVKYFLVNDINEELEFFMMGHTFKKSLGTKLFKIDKTAPILELYFEQTNIGSLTKEALTTTWRTGIVQGLFELIDSNNISNVVLYGVFEMTGSFTPNLDNTAADIPGYIATGTSNKYNTFDLDKYINYYVVVYDEAKNIEIYLIKPQIDNSTVELIIDLNDYTEGDWVSTDVTLEFSPNISGELPSSSGLLEYYYSTNQTTWNKIVGLTQVFSDTNETYYFKCQTPSNLISSPLETVTIRVDKTVLAFKNTQDPSSDDLMSNENPYTPGSWTYMDVDIKIRFALGISGGTLYYVFSESQILDFGVVDNWTQIAQYNVANQNNVVNSNDHILTGYVNYKLVNNANATPAYLTYEIKFDSTTLSWSDFELTTEDDEPYSGDWTFQEVKVSFGVSVYGSAASGVFAWYKTAFGNFDFSGNPIAISLNGVNSKYEFMVSSQSDFNYQFIITTGAGRTYIYNQIHSIRYDPTKPSLSVNITGTKALDNSNWFTSAVKLEYIVSNAADIISGYTRYYRYKVLGANDSSFIFTSSNELTLSFSESGGRIYVYEMYVISGAGVKSDIITPGPDQLDGVNVLKVDQSLYYLYAIQEINEFSVSYANITNTGLLSTYKRGDSAQITITCAENAYLKSIKIIVNGQTQDGKNGTKKDISFDYAEADTRYVNFTFTFTYNVVPSLHVDFYRELTISLNRLQTNVQDNIQLPSTSIYQNPLPSGANPEISILYNGDDELPNGIGEYNISLAIDSNWAEWLILTLTEGHNKFKIVYYRTQGSQSQPYQVNNYNDLLEINEYEKTSNAYLGNTGANAYYIQTADIQIDNFLNKVVINEFSGNYQGNNKEINFAGTPNLIGLFGNLKNATILNLGVRLDIETTIESHNSETTYIALLAAKSNNSIITGCYAIGSIFYGNNTFHNSAQIGGLISDDENSAISNSMANVYIIIANTNGVSGGGFIGTLNNSTITDCYVASQIEFLNGSPTEFANVSTYTNCNINYINDVKILKNNMFTENEIIDARFITSQNVVDSGTLENYDYFLSNETVIGNSVSDFSHRTLKALMELKTAAYTGNGHSENPFIISNYSDLALLSMFPNAAFKQIANITYNSVQDILINHQKPFAGQYTARRTDAVGSYSIIGYSKNLTVSGDMGDIKTYVGFFGPLKDATISHLTLSEVNLTVEFNMDGKLGVLSSQAINSYVTGIVLSGSMNIEATNSIIFIGGVIGAANNSQVTDSLSFLVITISSSDASIAGGIVGQAENGSALLNLISMGSIKANVVKYGYIGATLGRAMGNVTGSVIYGISNSLYLNNYEFNLSIGNSESSNVTGASAEFDSILLNTSNLLISGVFVESLMKSYTVFEGGTGSTTDPYLVATFKQLLEIEHRMYAKYKLVSNILIGDTTNTGSVDPNFVFNSIGNNMTFTGELDGDNHTISGLTTSLFYAISGSVHDLKLTVSIKIFTDGMPDVDLPANAGATIIGSGESVVMGSLAKYSLEKSNISSIIVTGEVTIKTMQSATLGIGKITFGGLVGKSLGGIISNPISDLKINIIAMSMDVGAICGEILGNVTLTSAIIMSNITIEGSKTNAGFVVGAIRTADYKNDFNTENIGINGMMVINGEASTKRVGVNANLNLI
jgi:hypothetical protein